MKCEAEQLCKAFRAQNSSILLLFLRALFIDSSIISSKKVMKRSYNEMSISLLPVLAQDDPRRFKMILEGAYKLRTVRVSDISKPSARPVADIDEPENEDEANVFD